MTLLSEFPAEILNQIFRDLPRSDLAALCRVHPILCDAAQPLLFDTIELEWTEHHVPPIIHLIRSILFRPELAHCIRHLKLLGDTFRWINREFRRVPLPQIPVAPTELRPLVAAIERLRLPYGPSWVQHLESGTMDAFSALLLACIPNLRSLRMEKNFTRQSLLVGSVLRSALCEGTAGTLPKFEHLQDVEFIDEYSEYRLCHHKDGRDNTYDVLPLFYLPALQSLDVLIDTPISGIFDWPAGQPGPSNLTSLKLYNLRETALEKILSATPALKSLRWSWYGGPSYRRQAQDRAWSQVINLQLLATALGHVRDTLENLHIAARNDRDSGHAEFPPLEMEGNLRPISSMSLRRLQAPWCFLAGFAVESGIRLEEVVPPTVEDLIISDDLVDVEECEWEDGEMAEMFPTFLESRRAMANRLRRLGMLVDGYYPEWHEESDASSRLRELCAKYHVELQLRCSQRPRPTHYGSS